MDRRVPLIFVVISLAGSFLHAADPPVTALQVSPDGKSMVVGSQTGIDVRGWPKLDSRRKLDSKLFHVHDLAFSPDGKRLAAAGGDPGLEGTIEVFEWPSGKLLWRQTVHQDLVYSIVWSPDSRIVVSASQDRSVKLLSSDDGRVQSTLVGHSRGVMAVRFTTADILVTASLDQSLRVWRLKTGDLIQTLDNHTKAVHGLATRPAQADGTLPMVASISEDRTVRLWQPTIGRMVRFIKLKSVPMSVAWTTGGRLLVVSCRDGHVRTIDPESVQVLTDHRAIKGWAYSLSLHPNGKSAVAGGSRGQLARVPIAKH